MTANKILIKLTKNFILYFAVPVIILTVVCGIFPDTFTGTAYASSDYVSAYEKGKRIFDEAGLLSDTEREELETLSKKYGEQAGIEIIVLTHNDAHAVYPEKYIEDFEDLLFVGDRVYFLYDLYRGEIFMEGYGLAETYIHSKRIDKIFDSMENDLRNGNYFEAFKTYIIQSAAYMEDDTELNYDHSYIYDIPPVDFDLDNEYIYDDYDYNYHYDNYYKAEQKKNNILFNVWFQLLIALLIGGSVVGILAYSSGGVMTAGARDYLDRSKAGLIGCKDQYTHSTVTKVRKPSSDSSSGGGFKRSGGFNAGGFRGGVSSSGRSHSSGGRKL
ncbi:MAG TPA: TPM domain-containing protein [Mobilitalea sp.]|nr:TPM domain-containing protein [Mobilitalea sp.]